MTNEQLFIAIGVPMLFNAVLALLLRASITDLRDTMNARFTDLKELWRAELHRVEEILDARLKHLEDKPS